MKLSGGVTLYTLLFLIFHLVDALFYEIETFPVGAQIFEANLRDHYADYSYIDLKDYLKGKFPEVPFEYNEEFLDMLDVKDNFDSNGFCLFDPDSNAIFASDTIVLKDHKTDAGMVVWNLLKQWKKGEEKDAALAKKKKPITGAGPTNIIRGLSSVIRKMRNSKIKDPMIYLAAVAICESRKPSGGKIQFTYNLQIIATDVFTNSQRWPTTPPTDWLTEDLYEKSETTITFENSEPVLAAKLYQRIAYQKLLNDVPKERYC